MSEFYERKQPKRPRRAALFAPFVVFALLFGLYSVYWVFMRAELDKGVDAWIADQRERGYLLEHGEKRLIGYPYRFALHVEDFRMADPSEGLDWSGEELQIVMQPWNLRKAIVRSPGLNQVSSPASGDIEVEIGAASAVSFVWNDTSLRRVGLTVDDTKARLSDGDIAIDAFAFNLAPAPEASDTARLSAQWEGVRLPRAPEEAVWLGDMMQSGRAAIEVSEAYPAMEAEDPLKAWTLLEGRMTVAQALINWGPLKLGAKGDVAVDEAGRLNGSASARIDEPQGLRAAIERAGALTEDLDAAVTMMEAASAGGRFATVSLVDGDVLFLGQSLGLAPIALSPAGAAR